MELSIFLNYLVPGIAAIFAGLIGFQIRNLYKRIEFVEQDLRKVEIELARNSEQNRGLMTRLDQIGGWCESIEAKLDRVITGMIKE